MILPYLSSAPPEAAKRMLRREIIQASGSLPDPWAFHPSVVLTEPHGPLPRRKSHYAVMPHSCMLEAVRHLQAGSRSCPERPSWRSPLLWLFITGSYLKNVYSVVKVRSDLTGCNNLVVTCISLSGKWMLFYDLGVHIARLLRSYQGVFLSGFFRMHIFQYLSSRFRSFRKIQKTPKAQYLQGIPAFLVALNL